MAKAASWLRPTLLLATIACGGGEEPPTQALDASAHPQSVGRVIVSPARGDILEGDSVQFRAQVLDEHGQPVVEPVTVSWRSSDPRIAIVDARGLVTAMTPGGTDVTASAGGVLGSAVVKVPVPPTIAFVSNRDGNEEVYRIAISGGGLKNLTNYSGADKQPRWSPDGQKIAFVRTGIAIGHNIWVMDADGSNPMSLTNSTTTLNDDPVWSPDGKKIAFVRDFGNGSTGGLGKEIYVMNADFGGAQTNLTNSPRDDLGPRWAPTGGKIAFLSQRDTVGGAPNQDVYTMNPNGSGVIRLTFGGSNEDLCWSPDAAKIALTSGDLGVGGPTIVAIPSGGGPMTALTNNNHTNYNCEWSPDGTRIAWTDNFDTSFLGVMNADGSNQLNLGFGTQPAWLPIYDLIAYVLSTQIAIIKPNGSGGKILTNSPTPFWNRDPHWKP